MSYKGKKRWEFCENKIYVHIFFKVLKSGLFTVPYFFHNIIEIECLPLWAAILVFKCAEGVGVGVYSGEGREARKIKSEKTMCLASS